MKPDIKYYQDLADKIKEKISDPEAAHELEDSFHDVLIYYLLTNEYDPIEKGELMKIVDEIGRLDFQRWCA